MSIDYATITATLERFEGRRLQGYVPCRPHNYTGGDPTGCTVIGASGVTIGTGVDLGQQSQTGLSLYGVPDALLDRFQPYLGKRKYAAIAALRNTPLTLTEAECTALDSAVMGAYTRSVERTFNAASAREFAACPPSAQAVLVSLSWQLGGHSRWPDGVWLAAVNGDWNSAAQALRSATSYKSRRNAEAAMLEAIA